MRAVVFGSLTLGSLALVATAIPATAQAARFPARPAKAMGGRAVFDAIREQSLAAREKRLVAEIERGNVPAFLRKPATVRFRATDAKGKRRRVVLRVLPDYLAVGSDRDFVRVPLTPTAAQRIADRAGFVLPTRRIIDLCHRHAKAKLAPKPLTERRTASETFREHHDAIEAQRRRRKVALGTLIAGIKKDVVVSSRVKPGFVAIYGWHRTSGKPIQPLYTKHAAHYVDYSHGIRFVWPTVTIDGRTRRVRDVLADPVLHPLLSDEGVILTSAQRYAVDTASR